MGSTGMLLLVIAIFIFVFLYQKKLTRQQNSVRLLEEDYQKELLAASIQIQEKERKRFAKDLHDDVGAMLSVMKINLSRIQQQVGKESPPHQIAEETKDMTDTLITQVRAIAKGLLPITLEQFGLSQAFEQFCKQVHLPSVTEVHYTFHGTPQRLEEQQELAWFRIGQELINNALKHAQASHIEVQLFLLPSYVKLLVKDDGIGLQQNDAAIKATGLGLKNVESRTKILSGTLTIQSDHKQGTVITIQAPIRNDEKITS